MSKVSFHSCVCLIDVPNFQKSLAKETKQETADFPENELLLRQLVFADKILLNKADLASEAQLSQVKLAIQKTNQTATTHVTSYSNVSLELLIEKPEQ